MRWGMFFLLLAVPTGLLIALLLALEGGKSELEDRVIRDQGSGSAAPEAESDASRRGVRLVRVGRFDNPVYVTAPPGDRRRIFVVEQSGRIRVDRKSVV